MSKKTVSKREQFTEEKKSRIPLFALGVGIIVVAAIIFIMSNSRGNEEEVFFGEAVAEPRSYVGQLVSMTAINPNIDGEYVKLSLEEIDKNNIVYFEVENNEKQMVPLMAYITPSGRLFTGSSLCEPCGGKTFSLAGETIVCDTCRTTYNIENHNFLSGSPVCGEYPPVNMNPEVVDGEVVIKLENILNWRSRV